MTGRKKEAGNVGEILTIGLCILALTALMISYMENVQLIAKKAEVGQLARCYLLKMETVGYLAAQDQTQLTAELENPVLSGPVAGAVLSHSDNIPSKHPRHKYRHGSVPPMPDRSA